MKKAFYITVMLLFVGFQLSATMFTITNKAQSTQGKSLGVDPYWGTNSREFKYLTFGGGKTGEKKYNTWHHSLREINVKYPNGRCFKINLEDMNLGRFSTDVNINIHDEGQAEIIVKTLRGSKYFPIIDGTEYSCR